MSKNFFSSRRKFLKTILLSSILIGVLPLSLSTLKSKKIIVKDRWILRKEDL